MSENNDKKNKKEQFIDTIKNILNHYVTIIVVIIVLQLVTIPFNNYILALILFILNLFSFIFFKDFLDEKKKKISYRMAILGLVIFGESLIIITTSIINSHMSKSAMPLAFFLTIGFLIGIFSFYMKEGVKEKLENIYNESLLEKIGIHVSQNNLAQNGDVILCKNIDNKKNVLLRYKDRFLHMLILGATGSGKTSQVILPMINQDMQNLDCGITVLEPKADLAEKTYAMAKHYGREAIYFNPILPDCPYFNPLFGKEEDVIENMATTFKMLNPDSPQFFLDMNENLIRYALKVLKRLMGDRATMIDLSRLLTNSQGLGRKMVMEFSRIKAPTDEIAKENGDIASWFLTEYFNEKSKVYEHCSGLRSQVAKITSNKYLRRVLNPPNGENDVDFDKCLEEGGVLAIATAQGKLRDLGKFLGYFLILNFQSSVFKRPGNEFTRRPHFLYIDEFQVYSNPGFADMLTQGRSYRVASHLATQNRALIGMGSGRDGQDFIELVSTNARNVIIYPGANSKDAKYYSEEFGEIRKIQKSKGISRAKFNPLYGFQQISYPNESIKEQEVVEARFSPTDIIYRPFGQITYRIIDNNSVQTPGVGEISYIDYNLNKTLDSMIDEYNKAQEEKEKMHDSAKTSGNLETESNEVADIVAKFKQDSFIKKEPTVIESDTFEEVETIEVDNTDEFFAEEEINNPLAHLEDLSCDDLI